MEGVHDFWSWVLLAVGIGEAKSTDVPLVFIDRSGSGSYYLSCGVGIGVDCIQSDFAVGVVDIQSES